mmetsp:Transcript_13619/g.31443  ORF Transcript_13619/g.31443 Transcript_13619/m.31443 type:complete len:84 (+) Transcript_13619:1950-2201(+)
MSLFASANSTGLGVESIPSSRLHGAVFLLVVLSFQRPNQNPASNESEVLVVPIAVPVCVCVHRGSQKFEVVGVALSSLRGPNT